MRKWMDSGLRNSKSYIYMYTNLIACVRRSWNFLLYKHGDHMMYRTGLLENREGKRT